MDRRTRERIAYSCDLIGRRRMEIGDAGWEHEGSWQASRCEDHSGVNSYRYSKKTYILSESACFFSIRGRDKGGFGGGLYTSSIEALFCRSRISSGGAYRGQRDPICLDSFQSES